MFLSACYFPEKEMTNDALHQEFPDWPAEKIEKKIGIVSRHIAAPEETALDLGTKAAENLFAVHPEMREQVDFLLFCTQSPDYFLPTGACILQNRLHLKKSTGAFDYNLGCSGYIYGLATAKGLLAGGIAQNVLLITAETYSRYLHPLDRGNRSIFGDAAAATLIRKTDGTSIGEFVLGTDGSGAGNLIVRNGGARNPVDPDAGQKESGAKSFYTDNHLYMNGPEIFNFTIEAVPAMVQEVLQKNNLTKDELDCVVFHQANSFMLNYLRSLLDFPEEKFIIDMSRTGNTVSSSLPVILCCNPAVNNLPEGAKVLLAGFGVGYSYGATVVTIQS